MKQLLQRINKLNALLELRQFESTNIYEKIMFSVHHKIRQLANEIDFSDIDEDDDSNCNNVEEIIGQAYEAAQQMAMFAGMDKDLIKFNLFNMEESSRMAEKLLKFNTLTETEMIILGDRNCEDSDEDVFDRVEGDDFIEDKKRIVFKMKILLKMIKRIVLKKILLAKLIIYKMVMLKIVLTKMLMKD